MERKLRALFDFQKYEQNEKLARIIAETEKKYYKVESGGGERLDDEDLFYVNAAGDPSAMAKKRGDQE